MSAPQELDENDLEKNAVEKSDANQEADNTLGGLMRQMLELQELNEQRLEKIEGKVGCLYLYMVFTIIVFILGFIFAMVPNH